MGNFDGVADTYNKSRHRYPPELNDHLVQIGALTDTSVVVDLGAGTGQLATMAAEVAAQVIAIDPEPDMVQVGQRATTDRPNIQWILGADRDVCALLVEPVDLVLIGNAFHHMDQTTLLRDLDTIVSPSGVVVVCSTSIPVWLQDTEWSVALRRRLSEELGRAVSEGGVPNHDSDLTVLGASQFSNVERWMFARDQQRTGQSIVGEVISSASGAISNSGGERLLAAIEPYLNDGAVIENVKTTALVARRPSN